MTRLQEPHLLVLTSGLYEKYNEHPQELRFIIGHELGHLKCDHIRCHTVGSALVHAIVRTDSGVSVKDGLVANLLVGQLLRWFRESEISADRAGLICIGGDEKVAQKALLRLLHGTNEEDIDPEKAVREQIDFENERFVKIMRYLRAFGTTHPFIPERCLALRQWKTSSGYLKLEQRLAAGTGRSSPPKAGKLVVESVEIQGLPDTDSGFGQSVKCDPLIHVVCGDQEKTSDYQTNNPDPSFTDLEWEFGYVENCPLFVEVLDYDSVTANDFVGSCLLNLSAPSGEVTADLRLDVKERCTIAQLPRVKVKYRVVQAEKKG